MTGALIQLVAYGVENLYLTADPQITFFKVVYRRHTNFAFESIRQDFSSKADFGQKVTCTIGRTGDLIGQVFLYVKIPPLLPFFSTHIDDPIKKIAWVRYLGFALIKEMTFEIGGKLIDRSYGEFLYIWEQLSTTHSKGISKMIGNIPELFDFTNGKNCYDLYIPLKYYFCRYNGLALPLIALASVDVKLTFTFRCVSECIRIGPTHSIRIKERVVPFELGDYIVQTACGQTIHGYFINFDYITQKLSYIKICSPTALKRSFDSGERIFNPISCMGVTPDPCHTEIIEDIGPWTKNIHFIQSWLYINYIFLDTDERYKFARSANEYLIDQIQFNKQIGITSPNVGQNLNLSHPCKAHYWVAQLDCMVSPCGINDLFNFTDSPIRYPDGRFYGRDLVRKAVLLLNGNKRFNRRESDFFNLTEPYSRQTRGPVKGINMYSFCLKPEDHQPSGTCNMSKFDYITMKMTLSKVVSKYFTASVRSYTLNYNVLRIFFNLGGLAFFYD